LEQSQPIGVIERLERLWRRRSNVVDEDIGGRRAAKKGAGPLDSGQVGGDPLQFGAGDGRAHF
jgi:hypothetical protein